MREVRTTIAEVTIGQMIVSIGGRTIHARLAEHVSMVPVGTFLVGARGGRRVVTQAGDLVLAPLSNGVQKVVRVNTTVIVLTDTTD